VDVARVAAERIWPGRRVEIAALGGGITNHNFRVAVGNELFVLRLGGAKTDLLGIDRRSEFEAGRRAFEVGVGPEVIALVAAEGWLVARFIDGRPVPPEQMRLPQTLARVAAALRALHGAAPIPGRFDAHEVVEDYRRKAVAHDVSVPAEFDEAWSVARRIRAARGEQPPVPCHNDLLNANFLDDGAIRIVDWEYAGMGDRFFDLANFSVNHEFSVEDDRRLLQAYFGEARDGDLASLRLMRFMSDFREAMWGVLQSGISELDFAFMAYAEKHFARLAAAAGDASFESYFSALR
jgi:thiamine kinase-like enzyme